MMSLFSSFDNFFYHFTLIPPIFFSVFISFLVFKNSIFYKIMDLMASFFVNFFYSLGSNTIKFWHFLAVSLFLTIFSMNLVSVGPWSFANTSMISVVLSFSMLFWISIILFSTFMCAKSFLAHMIPEGTPMSLLVFIFIIELVSAMIRPITLTVRLVANIMAGHILLILLSGLVFSFSYSYIFYLVLNLVEIFVSIVQAYIFVTMVYLYSSEMS